MNTQKYAKINVTEPTTPMNLIYADQSGSYSLYRLGSKSPRIGEESSPRRFYCDKLITTVPTTLPTAEQRTEGGSFYIPTDPTHQIIQPV